MNNLQARLTNLRRRLIRLLIGDMAVIANCYFNKRHYPQFAAEPLGGLLIYSNAVEGEGECGFECGWTEPFGFVSEAGCPVHDGWPESGYWFSVKHDWGTDTNITDDGHFRITDDEEEIRPAPLGTTWWVDEERGSDANSGLSPDEAFATRARGIAAATASNVVHIVGGREP